MQTGILLSALAKAVPLELEYRTVPVSNGDDTGASSEQEWVESRSNTLSHEFNQLLMAI